MFCGRPRSAPLSWNCTLPVGVPAPGEFTDTFAVKVVGAPKSDGLADDDTTEVVSAAVTTWPPAREPLLSSTLGSLLVKSALTGWLPTERGGALNDATPLALTGWGAPAFAPSALN